MGNEQKVLIRTSERSTYRRCRQKWKWSYGLGLEANRPANALRFGSLIHEALALYYVPGRKRGEDPAEAFLRLYRAQEAVYDQWDDDGERIPADELGVAMLRGYVERYGDDDDLEVVCPEMTFRVPVHQKNGTHLFDYVGSIDIVAKRISTGRYCTVETKTAKVIPDIKINSQYGEQGLAYWWAATIILRERGLLGPDETIDDVLYNVLRKGIPDTRPVNDQGHSLNKPKKEDLVAELELAGEETKGTVATLVARLYELGWTERDVELLGEPAKRQPAPLFSRQTLPLGPAQLLNFEKRLRMEGWEMRQARTGKLPITKNPTRDCSWECQFSDVCEVHEMGGDWQSMLQLDFRRWDPYSDHEVKEEKVS